MSINIFEQGTRQKVKFNYKGVCPIEDLWDVPLNRTRTNKGLKDLYQELKVELAEFRKLRSGVDDEIDDDLLEVSTKSKEEKLCELKLAIVKHIYKTRKAEQDAKLVEKKNAEADQEILELIKEKKKETLKGKSVEELEALLKRK